MQSPTEPDPPSVGDTVTADIVPEFNASSNDEIRDAATGAEEPEVLGGVGSPVLSPVLTARRFRSPTPSDRGSRGGRTTPERPLSLFRSFPRGPGSVASDRSDSRRSERTNPGLISDMYMETPVFRDLDQYEPWPAETDERFAGLLSTLTEPTHTGMLERADPHGELQKFMASDAVPVSTRVTWERVLECYDIAMMGKRSALLALCASHERIRELQGQAHRLDIRQSFLDDKCRTLEREVDRLETQLTTQQRQISSLEHMAEEASRRERVYDRTMHEREKQREYLEGLIANWDTLGGTAATQSTAGGEGGRDPRFMELMDGLEEARVKAYMTTKRCAQLEGRNYDLKKFAEELESQNQALEKEFAVMRARGVNDEQTAQLLERVTREHDARVENMQAEIEDLKKDLGVYKDQCQALERTAYELQERLDSQAAEAAHEKRELESTIQEVEDSLGELNTLLTEKLSNYVDNADDEDEDDEGAGANPLGINIQGYPSSGGTVIVHHQEADRQPKVPPLKAMVREVRSNIGHVVERIETELANAQGIQVEKAKLITDELKNIATTADILAESEEVMEEGQALVQKELGRLQQQMQSHRRAFQDMREQSLLQQHAQLEAARATSWHSGDTERPLAKRFSTLEGLSAGVEEIAMGASEDEIRCLQGALDLITQLRENAQTVRTEDAARMCSGQLVPLLEKLKPIGPGKLVGDGIAALKKRLDESVAKGVGNDSTEFYIVLDEQRDRLQNLLTLCRDYSKNQPQAERDLLNSIQQKLDKVKKLQATQESLMREYETYRAQHAARDLTPKQSEELLRLASSAVNTPDSSLTWPSAPSEVDAAAMEGLVVQIQNMTADSYLRDRIQELNECIKKQEAALPDLRREIHEARQLRALGRLQLKSRRPMTTEEDDANDMLSTSLEMRETTLLRDYGLAIAYVNRAAAGTARATKFLEKEETNDRRRAETLLAKTLLQLQATGAFWHHGEAACFCTLLRFLFPPIYSSTSSDGCGAGGTANPSASSNTTKPLPSCQGHHGHGIFPFSGRISTFVCCIMTSLTWLVLLILIQPYNLRATAAFLTSSLLGLLVYLYRVSSHTFSRLLRTSISTNTNNRHLPGSSAPKFDRPSISKTRVPPPSVIVGSAVSLFVVFAWLSYVAVLVERRIWVGNNDWRFAYVLDLTSGKPVPYPWWAPVRVDYRLVTDLVWYRLWTWFAEGVHGMFHWKREAFLRGG